MFLRKVDSSFLNACLFLLVVFLLSEAYVIPNSNPIQSTESAGYKLTKLHAKKKKGSLKDEKVQVRLLKDVKDQGRKGDIIKVSKGMWMNNLQPNKFAEVVTDDVVQKMNEQKAAQSAEKIESAENMKEKINSLEAILVDRKVDGKGKLFGKLNSKQILKILKEQFPLGALDAKGVSITEIFSCSDDGSSCNIDVEKGHIEVVGKYQATVRLCSDPLISASFKLDVNGTS